MLSGFFGALGRAQEKHDQDTFQRGKVAGVEEGIRIGMTRHTELTSELTEEENEMVLKFLTLHNLVLCYDPKGDGFRVKRNDRLNPQLPKRVYIVPESNISPVTKEYAESKILEAASVSLARYTIMQLDSEYRERERQLYYKNFK